MSNTHTEIQRWLIEEFSSRLATVFETMAGERPGVKWSVAAAPSEASLRWRQPFLGTPGAVWIAAAEADWNTAGGHVLRAAGIEESDASTLRSTYLETISQALSGLAQALSARERREVTCAGGEEGSVQPVDAIWASVDLQLGSESATIAIGIESALLDALLTAAPAPEPASEQRQGSTPESPAPPPAANPKTFELLLDVELPVSLSFGRAQVLLKDLLKLTTGSIVELNRSIIEPVEVIVNNCVIARGEVVVVEGNFGVRIQQVISRQERLRTLN